MMRLGIMKREEKGLLSRFPNKPLDPQTLTPTRSERILRNPCRKLFS